MPSLAGLRGVGYSLKHEVSVPVVHRICNSLVHLVMLDEMEAQGFSPNYITYRSLISAYAAHRMVRYPRDGIAVLTPAIGARGEGAGV